MSTSSDAHGQSEAPLYVRWGPSGSPYAIELKLDLVAKIRDILVSTMEADSEVGGVLVGSLPSSQSPTLRIEEVEMIPREASCGATFLIDPSHETRVEETRRNARAIGRSVVGLFRSHWRPGALRPSLADRSLLSSLFHEAISVLLLVEGKEPFSAAFFVTENRQLPAEPSVREFRFDDRDFKQLPELEPEAIAPRREDKPATPRRRFRTAPVVAAATLLLALGLIFYASGGGWQLPEGIPLLPSSQLNLAVTVEGPGLRVSWNHAASDLQHASGARLTIRRTNGEDREIRLGPDELRLGAVAMENQAPRVEVMLVIENPGAPATIRSARWSQS